MPLKRAAAWLVRASALAVLSTLALLGSPRSLAAGGKLYWVEYGIKRANTDGTGVEAFLNDTPEVRSLAVDAKHRKLYWLVPSANEIRRGDLDGGDVQVVVKAAFFLQAFALDLLGDSLYWVEGNAVQPTFRRSKLDGSNAETLFSVPWTLAVDMSVDPATGHIYWGDVFSTGIRRANTDGSDIRTLVGDSPYRLALDLAGGRMYWSSQGRIRRAHLDGSGIETVAQNLGEHATALDIALDPEAGFVYWTGQHEILGAIRRARLDGSLPQTLVSTSILSSFELALDPGDVSFELEGAPNPVVAGEPFGLRLTFHSRRADFVGTFALHSIAGAGVAVLSSTPGIAIPFGTSVVHFLIGGAQFPAGLPPAVAFMAVLTDEATGEVVAVDTERIRIKP